MTMEDYFQTKARLFTQMKPNGKSIVRTGDQWGNRLADQLLTSGDQVFTYGETVQDQAQLLKVDSLSPLRFSLRVGDKLYHANMGMPGIYNAWNATAAWLTADSAGIDSSLIQRALRDFPGVPGRFEVYDHPRGAQFIVDYAHTPDGLDQFLETLNALKSNRIIHIFGFRGNGDPSKRRIMLAHSLKWSDTILLTLDDLKGIDPRKHLEELRALAAEAGRGRCIVMEDRTQAIAFAWHHVQKGDFVAITGKGREPYEQTFALPSASDSETIQYLLRNES
ncbi:glutamate ligase domain-containing protein [Cohnella algarum]|uniref:glutamate ligase domain-containing protein n=1 Tax=Cohnella algarum TaxID=2044859 RepID=UPI0019677644|nr:cyanophycin synthetase [Cohnella algarum]MBN2981803.1 hypothetical protein [Cohnella algarum]